MFYMSLPQPYRSANRDFRSVEELLLVRGVTRDLFYGGLRVRQDGAVERQLGLVDCLTVHTHSTQVNVNYAPLPVLLSIPGLDSTLAQFLMQAREKKPIASMSDFTRDYPVLVSGETLSFLSTGSSGVYTLAASAVTPAGIMARVRSVVRVSGLDTPASANGSIAARPGPPFLVLSWDDSYVR
jgi:general secretion pathway protein K